LIGSTANLSFEDFFIQQQRTEMIGKKYEIAGMILEIKDDAGEEWVIINTTTKDIINFNKIQLQDAIKLGKVVDVSDAEKLSG
jgi:hypothetical protein